MPTQDEAILKLLGDDDAVTLQLVKAKLAELGVAGLPRLRRLLAAARAPAAVHLRDVIAEIEEREADAVFAQLCAHFTDDQLEEAAWKLAATFDSGSSFLAERELLDQWGAELARRLKKAPTALDRVETLAEYLAYDLDFTGNEMDYHHLDNSLLPAVIESRRGLPITLSLVYQLVAARAGMDVAGVALPGHFIVRHAEVFFDPFHGGRRLGLDDCKLLMERQGLVLQPHHLARCPPRLMLMRMMMNIVAVSEHIDPALARKVEGWIELLRPVRS